MTQVDIADWPYGAVSPPTCGPPMTGELVLPEAEVPAEENSICNDCGLPVAACDESELCENIPKAGAEPPPASAAATPLLVPIPPEIGATIGFPAI